MNTLIGQHFTWGPSIEEGEGIWSNADRGRGKEPCGRPQAGTFFSVSACIADTLYG